MKLKAAAGVICLLVTSILLFPRGKYVNIGKCRWYTEQNSFNEILTIAKEKTKQVLVFYSATWCGPCQRAKEDILSAGEFREAVDDLILLFVEVTEEKGREYVDKHRVKFFPTMKFFSREGVELATNLPDDSVKSVLKWLDQAKDREHLIKRLLKNPADWRALFKATQWDKEPMLTSDQYEPNIDLLRKALGASAGPDNANRRRARERLALYLYLTLENKRGSRAAAYARRHKKEFTGIIRLYYPNNFRFELKKENALAMWINWLSTAGDHKAAVKVFEHALSIETRIDPYRDMKLLRGLIKCYLALGQDNKAGMWADKIAAAFKSRLKKKGLESPPLTYLAILQQLIEHNHDKKKNAETQKYTKELLKVLSVTKEKVDEKKLFKAFRHLEEIAGFFSRLEKTEEVKVVIFILKGMIDSFRDKSCRRSLTIQLAKRYGFFVNQALGLLTKMEQKAYPKLTTYMIVNRAVLLARNGEQRKASTLIMNEYDKIKDAGDVNKSALSRTLNSLAWAFVEMEAVDEMSLKIAERSVHYDRNSANLDTLATIHAELGNFHEAVKWAKEALKMAKREQELVEIEEKLARWEKAVE